jgi:hypothetical protein
MATTDITEKEVDEIFQETKPTELVGIGIQGLENIPASVIPIPYVRLVQPSSTKTETNDGKEAMAGTYLFNDTQEAVETLEFAILKAKYGEVEYKRDEELIKSTRIAILGATLTDFRPFILTLSVMSFTNFGQLVSKLKVAGAKKVWEYKIIATSEKNENKKGKYYTAKFELGKKLDPEAIASLEEKYSTYASSFDRAGQNDEEISV